jgi:glycosyltransferase involved in cell wall biosynthesis
MTTSSSKYFKLVRFLEPISLRRARMLTTESRFGVNYLHEHYPHLRIHQIEHATGQVFHEIMRKPQARPLRLLTVCTLGYAKGGDLLLKALNSLMDVPFELVVIGGEDRNMTGELRRTLHPDLWKRIQFLNNLTAIEVADQMSRATFLVHPTRADTSPNSVKEAAVSGLPVIASNIGGIPDYIVHERNGFLFPPGDQEALTGRLREAIQHPLFGAGKVDPAVHANVRAYLSPQRMGELFWSAYQCAMELRHAAPPTAPLVLQETPAEWAAHH